MIKLTATTKLIVSLGLCLWYASAQALTLKLIGSYSIPTETTFNHQPFGGISGIDHLQGNQYIAISDHRGGQQKHPSFYELMLDYDTTGFKDISISKQHFFKQQNGNRFSASLATVDPESIRLAPNGHYYWSSEGNYSKNKAMRTNPHIHEIQADGTYVRAFHHPEIYNYVDNKTTGGRDNNLFEALTVDAHGTVFVANEEALIQDGHTATDFNPSAVRVTAFDAISARPLKQYAYILPSIPDHGLTIYQVNGLTELLSIGHNRFLALERAFIAGVGNHIHIVQTRITPETTDVLKLPSLIGTHYTPMTRKVLLALPPIYKGIKIDNIEGMTLGKKLKNGHQTLILVSDNNFSSSQTTQFLAFEIIPDQ